MKTFDVKIGPYIKDKNSTSKIMLNVIIALIPIILFSFYKNGYVPYSMGYGDIYDLFYPLLFVLIGALASFALEMLYALIFLRKKYNNKVFHYLKTSYSFMPGLFMALVLPLSTPLPVLLLGVFVAVIIGKMVFGGFGQNIFNPALIGVLFIMICFSSSISTYANLYEIDAISSSTPLTNENLLIENNQLISADTLIKPYGSLLDFFIGNIPGSVGEVSSILIIAGFIFLVITKSVKWKITLTYVATSLIMTFIIGMFNGVGYIYPIYQILSGGLLFGAVFMATDPVTSPTTFLGQIIYGIGLGILTILIRFLLPYLEGVLISILCMNMLVFIIDRIGFVARCKKYVSVISILSLIIVLGSLSLYIGYSSQKTDEIDTNFSINERTINGNTANYTVSQKHKYGTVKANIVINNGNIVSIEIISPNDSYINLINKDNYIERLINGENNLNAVDTVSGATYSSTALKNLVINTLNDYNGEKKEVEEIKDDSFTIISKEKNDDETIYVVNVKGYIDFIKMKFVVNNNTITSAEILQYNDNEYVGKILAADYLNILLNKQNNLDDVDTVSGATYTSNYLKEAFVKLMKEYKGNVNEGA